MAKDSIVLDRGWNRPLFSSVCSFCRHFRPVERDCAAFPDQLIPEEIWDGDNDHTEPFPGDNGIRFEAEEEGTGEESEEGEDRAEPALPAVNGKGTGQGSWFSAFLESLEKTNPYHDPETGRFTSRPGAGMAGELYDLIAYPDNPDFVGFSRNIGRNRAPKTGYMVSVQDGPITPREEFNSGTISRFMKQNAKTLRRPDIYLGAWESGGKIYLDISTRKRTIKDAMEIGMASNQIAIWDNSKYRELQVQHYRDGSRRFDAEGKPKLLENERYYSRPLNETFAEFKEWLLSIGEVLGVPIDMSPQEWVTLWRDFWGLSDSAKPED